MSGSRATAATATPRTAEAAVAVAYSGGRDSTALLHATLAAARDSGLAVHALHVHHGLSTQADAWLAHCEAQCRRWARAGHAVHFHAERLALKPARGESVEALARDARYAALARLARAAGCGLVLLAQHRRDQAETFLLQALRGAGAAGLAAMPARVERDGLVWARPWLERPREAIEAYLRRHRLRHVEDDSNADPRYARNRLRLEVWPALLAAFPQAEASLADAARRAQEAAQVAAGRAALDLATCVDDEGALKLAAWQGLDPVHAGQALRLWIARRSGRAPTAAELERLREELPGRAPARWTLQAGGELRRYRGRLRYEGGALPAAQGLGRETQLHLRGAGRYPLPGWGGVLVAERVAHGGLAIARLQPVRLVARVGGERFQPASGRPPRSLKKQFQAAGLPAWARGGALLYDGAQLLFVPGLGVDARALAAPGEPQLALRWEPASAGGGEGTPPAG